MLIFYLSAFMIQMVFIPVDQFGNGNNRIALVFQLRNQRIQRLSREFCPVMAEDDRAVSQMLMLRHGLDDGIHAIVFPVKRIHIPLNCKVPAVFGHIHHRIVVIPIGRPEQEHLIAGQVPYLFMDLHQFVLLYVVGKLAHVFMILAVVSQVVAGGQKRPQRVRVGLHPPPPH